MPRRIDVKQLRDDMGLSQPKIAALLGVHARTVQRWELADNDPSPLALEKLRALHEEHTKRTANGQHSAGEKGGSTSVADALPPPLHGLLPSLR